MNQYKVKSAFICLNVGCLIKISDLQVNIRKGVLKKQKNGLHRVIGKCYFKKGEFFSTSEEINKTLAIQTDPATADEIKRAESDKEKAASEQLEKEKKAQLEKMTKKELLKCADGKKIRVENADKITKSELIDLIIG